MNFTKKLIAIGAITLAATFANAQSPWPADYDLEMKISLEAMAFMDITPKNNSGVKDWAWGTLGGGTTADVDSLKQIAEILVETNVPAWDVTVKSKYAGLLRIAGTATKGDTLKAIVGTGTDPVKVQLFTCVDQPAVITDPICKPTSLTTTTTVAGKVAALTTAGVSLATASGKTSGYQQADMHAVAIDGGTGLPVGFTPSAQLATKAAPYLRIGVYAGLYSNKTATSAISQEKLVGDGDYKDVYTFSLVKKY